MHVCAALIKKWLAGIERHTGLHHISSANVPITSAHESEAAALPLADSINTMHNYMDSGFGRHGESLLSRVAALRSVAIPIATC